MVPVGSLNDSGFGVDTAAAGAVAANELPLSAVASARAAVKSLFIMAKLPGLVTTRTSETPCETRHHRRLIVVAGAAFRHAGPVHGLGGADVRRRAG